MAKDVAFDSSALLAFLKDEPAAEQVEKIIVESRRDASALLMTTVNMGEVWYGLGRLRLDADAQVTQILNLGFVLVDVDWQIAHQAAELKLHYKLGYADSYAVALAKVYQAELVTCDADFQKVAREVKVRLLKGK
jgi:predicted nucleic acid-binding protein